LECFEELSLVIFKVTGAGVKYGRWGKDGRWEDGKKMEDGKMGKRWKIGRWEEDR
jgi:hypothetical protein